MRVRLTLSSVLGSALVVALACDPAPKAELEAARADLKTAQADLQRAQEQLVAATAELKASRETFEASNASKTRNADNANADALPRHGQAPAEDQTAAIQALTERAASAIECQTEGPCTIERGFLDAALDDPGLLARQARIVPSVRDGVSLGFKLYGIRSSSIPKMFGFKNGDLITAINDLPLTSLDEALSTYTKLRESTSLTFHFERKGQKMSRTVEIVADAPK